MPRYSRKTIRIIFVGNILINYFYLFERLILTFAQIERLCELLHNRFAVSICDLGDPRERYSVAPYIYWILTQVSPGLAKVPPRSRAAASLRLRAWQI